LEQAYAQTAIISFATGAIALVLLVLPHAAQAMTLTAPSAYAIARAPGMAISGSPSAARRGRGTITGIRCAPA
jgi:hypothetical protein